MKKITALACALIMLVSVFAACADDPVVEELYTHRTSAFYMNMDQNGFWFKATVLDKSGLYLMTQATDGINTTTVIDHTVNDYDCYEIFHNGSDYKYIHKINVSQKKYDTVLTSNGRDFMFKGYNYTMFANPVSQQEEELDGEVYYCETFKSADAVGGTASGYDKYYFNGNTLVAVVTSSITIRFEEYANEKPSHIYLEAPADFKAGSFTQETSIDYSGFFTDE